MSRKSRKPSLRHAGRGGAVHTDATLPPVWSARDSLIALALLAALLLVYYPALHGTPIWDDAYHLTRPGLQSWAGLARIWWDLEAAQQYYPVTHSLFWVEHRIWGDWYEGYHLVNVLLHWGSALLLVRLLRRLQLRGPWFAAALWALHPLQVETVAWMSELKNTLSGLCYFGAALLYLRYLRERSVAVYGAALGAFMVGLLAKSVIVTLAPAMLVVLYWRQGRLLWRRDILPLMPFFFIGLAGGLFTSWVERAYIGASGASFGYSLVDRCLIAGRVFWFYLGKLAWPANLIFAYPRWHISAGAWWQYLFPVAALALVALLAAMRVHWGRGPLAAALYFAITLFPALGFVNVYPFRYSFVADHFQYLAGIGPIVLFAGGMERLRAFWKPSRSLVVSAWCGLLLACASALSWRQSAIYSDVETLWRATLAANPDCFLAHLNMGKVLRHKGLTDDAMAQYLEAMRLAPDNEDAYNAIGDLAFQVGRMPEAMEEYRKSLRINPNQPRVYAQVGNILLAESHAQEAVAQLSEAVRRAPDDTLVRTQLGNALLAAGHAQAAVAELNEAARRAPDEPLIEHAVGNALYHVGQLDEAVVELKKAVRDDPSNADACYDLAVAQFGAHQCREARASVERALAITPANPEMRAKLAWILATASDLTVRDGARAVQLATALSEDRGGKDPLILRTLAAACAQDGQFGEAIRVARRALELSDAANIAPLSDALRREIGLYEAGQPYNSNP